MVVAPAGGFVDFSKNGHSVFWVSNSLARDASFDLPLYLNGFGNLESSVFDIST